MKRRQVVVLLFLSFMLLFPNDIITLWNEKVIRKRVRCVLYKIYSSYFLFAEWMTEKETVTLCCFYRKSKHLYLVLTCFSFLQKKKIRSVSFFCLSASKSELVCVQETKSGCQETDGWNQTTSHHHNANTLFTCIFSLLSPILFDTDWLTVEEQKKRTRMMMRRREYAMWVKQTERKERQRRNKNCTSGLVCFSI